jgi:hypothetical protein
VGHMLPSSYPSVPMEDEEESNENKNQHHWRSPTLQNLYPDCHHEYDNQKRYVEDDTSSSIHHHGDNPIVSLVQHPPPPPPQQQPSSSLSSSDDDDDLSPPIVERCSIENDSFVQYLDRIHTFTQQQQQQQQPPPSLSSPQPTHDNHHDTIPCRTTCGFVATGTSVDLGDDTSPSTVGTMAPIQLLDGTGSNETTVTTAPTGLPNNNHVSDATTRTETTNHLVEDRPCDTTTTTNISCTTTPPYVVCMEFISNDNHHDGLLPSERTIHADHNVETMELPQPHNVSVKCDNDTNETTVTSIATDIQHTPIIVDQLQEAQLQRKIVTASTSTKIRPDTENHHPPLATMTPVHGENDDHVRCRISPKCLYLDPHHDTRHDQNVPFVATTTTTIGTSKRSRSELGWSETEPKTIHPILVSVPTDDEAMDTRPDQRTIPATAAAAVIVHTNSNTDQYGILHPAMDPTHGVVLYHNHRWDSMSETKENTCLPAAQSNIGSKDKPTDYTLDGNKVQHYHNSISHPNEQPSFSDPDTGGTPPWLRSAPPPTALLSRNVLPPPHGTKSVRPTKTTIPKHTSPDNFSYVSTLPPNSLCSDNDDDDDDDYDYPDGVPNHAPPAGNFARRYPVGGTVLGTIDRQSLVSSSHKRKDPPEQNQKYTMVCNIRSVATTTNWPRTTTTAKTTRQQPPPVPLPADVPMDPDSHKKLKWTRNRRTNMVVQPKADHRTATTATTAATTTTTMNTSGTSPRLLLFDTAAIQPDIPLSLSLRSAAEAANDSGWWIYHPPHNDHGGGGVVESMVSSSSHATKTKKKKKRTLPKSIHIQKKKYVL